jgi:hypothetical protein
VVSPNCGLINFLPCPLTETSSIIQEPLNYAEYYPVGEQTLAENDLDWSLSSHNFHEFNDDDLANLEPRLGDYLPGNLLTTETLISNQSLAAVNDFPSLTSSNQIAAQSRRPIASPLSRYHYAAVDSDYTPKGLYIQKLAELSVSLYRHALKFPLKLSKQSPSKTESSTSIVYETFPFDKTFLLAQDLLEVLANLCPNHEESTSSLPTSNSQHLKPPEGFNATVVYHGHETSRDSWRSTSPPLSSLDDATTLLIISCYAHLIDILGIIFTHMEKRMKTCSSPASQQVPLTWFLPQVQIGSFALASALALPMQALLGIQVMSELFS